MLKRYNANYFSKCMQLGWDRYFTWFTFTFTLTVSTIRKGDIYNLRNIKINSDEDICYFVPYLKDNLFDCVLFIMYLYQILTEKWREMGTWMVNYAGNILTSWCRNRNGKYLGVPTYCCSKCGLSRVWIPR